MSKCLCLGNSEPNISKCKWHQCFYNYNTNKLSQYCDYMGKFFSELSKEEYKYLLMDWYDLIIDDSQIIFDNICNIGYFILKYNNYKNKKMSKFCFETIFLYKDKKYNVIAFNGYADSFIFNFIENKDNYDFFVFFQIINKELWKIGLRGNNKNIDLSLIAKDNNGGGHFNSSGFVTNNINKFITI